ncbi:MAG: homoserine kinase, partial [bacterium]|nr:homoserine kinase [bacterium]
AVDWPGDEVIAKRTRKPGVKISKITGDEGKLSLDPHENTSGVSVLSLLQHLQSNQGFELELHKKMPLGSGLGSSAASAIASLVAVNILLNEPLEKEELLPFALDAEKAACGFAHADNVAPALFGGFVLIRSYKPLDVIRIPTPEELYCTIFHPQIEIKTGDARKILKRNITLGDAIIQWGNIAGLVAG